MEQWLVLLPYNKKVTSSTFGVNYLMIFLYRVFIIVLVGFFRCFFPLKSTDVQIQD